ncbi:hypothetical protein ABVY98_001280 [Escherichia coli]
MGFWDVVTGLGKSASNVVSERMKANYWDMWNKIKSSPVDRINDFYNQNNTNDCNRASYRGLAMLLYITEVTGIVPAYGVRIGMRQTG